MTHPLIKIDESVIARVNKGDVAAFDMLYRAYCTRLYGFVLQIIKTDSDAEEIVQEVFLKLWEARLQIDKHAVFESYLFTIAYNTTISLIRKKLSEKKYIDYVHSIQEVSAATGPDGEAEFEELSQQLQNLVEKLYPFYQPRLLDEFLGPNFAPCEKIRNTTKKKCTCPVSRLPTPSC
jgi:RNA polymerase sigma-70 factor, ECF subfamily